MPRFTAMIRKVGINPCVAVPGAISRAFARRGYVPVIATLGGKNFPANLVPVGGGRHRLYLNLPMRQAARRDTGDRITVGLAADATSRVLSPPADLLRALRASGQLPAFLADAPSHRKEIIRWVEGAQGRDTRRRRIAKAVAYFPRRPYRG